MVAENDIVQIINPEHHWFPALVIVDEPKSFGCQGYIHIPADNRGNVNQAYIRLESDDFIKVGEAVVIRGESAVLSERSE